MSDILRQLTESLGSQYRLERELGGGGMSRVFLAEEVALARNVVIKVLPPEMAAGVNQERFRREIQLAARLQHPHIVPLLAAGSAGDVPNSQLGLFAAPTEPATDGPLARKLKDVDVNVTTPLQALALLEELKRMAEDGSA